MGGIDIKGLILELEKTSKIELDFTNEAVNLENFWANNAGREGVTSPKCYREYTNEVILTEDFVIGHEVGDLEYIETLTNLARGITAAEGTVKTLSPRVNILNYFIDKVDVGIGLDLDFSNLSDEQLAELNGPVAMELMKFFDSTSRSAAKTAETLDMLEKGQIGVRTDFGFEQKALGSVERMVSFVVRALMAAALFIGSCLLSTVPVGAMETTPFLVAFPIVGSIGYVASIFFAWRLYKGMKKD